MTKGRTLYPFGLLIANSSTWMIELMDLRAVVAYPIHLNIASMTTVDSTMIQCQTKALSSGAQKLRHAAIVASTLMQCLP